MSHPTYGCLYLADREDEILLLFTELVLDDQLDLLRLSPIFLHGYKACGHIRRYLVLELPYKILSYCMRSRLMLLAHRDLAQLGSRFIQALRPRSAYQARAFGSQ